MLIPIFKPYTIEQLVDQFQLEFDLPEWVSIEFTVHNVRQLDSSLDTNLNDNDTTEYECNRYDAMFVDKSNGRTITVYIYMNEGSNKIIAVDSVVQDVHDADARYSIIDTPLGEMLKTLQNI